MIEGVPVYGQIWCPNLLLNLMLQSMFKFDVPIFMSGILRPNLYG